MALTHAQAVCSLYRRALKTCLSWAWQRDLWYEEAAKIRAQFDANKHADPIQAKRLLERGEEMLAEKSHCDPYIVPYRPGGSLYARNPPFPPGMKQVLDFGREGH